MTKADEIFTFIMIFVFSGMILQVFHFFFSFDGPCGLKRLENSILYIRKITDRYLDGELKLTYKNIVFKIKIQSEDYDRYTKYQVFINDELAMSLHKLEKEITYTRYYKVHNNRSTNEVWKVLKAGEKLCKETVKNHTEAKIREPLYRSYFK